MVDYDLDNSMEVLPDVDGAADVSFIDEQVFTDLKHSIGTEVFQTLLEKLQTDLVLVRSELKMSQRLWDKQQIVRSTHVLISLSGAFGAKLLQSQAMDLNLAAQQNDLNDLEQKVQDCLDGVGLFIGFVVGKLSDRGNE